MLTRKNTKWQWGKEQEGAFEGLKTTLSEAPALRPPQWGPKHGNADGLIRAKVQEDMMSYGIDDEIECAFRADVEYDPHYRSIIDYPRTREVHLPGANERRQLRAMAMKYTLRNDELYYRDTDGD